MTYNIFIEDLVSNAFIIALDFNERFLTYEEIEYFGGEVIKYLDNLNIKASLNLSKIKTDAFLIKYSHFFEGKDIFGIRLKENITKSDLIKEFRGSLPIDLLLGFVKVEEIHNNNYQTKEKTLIYKSKNEQI